MADHVPVTSRQVQALEVLAAAGRPLTPAHFAARLWPGKDWARSGGAHEAGPDASGRHGARMLVGLARLGLVQIRRRAGYWDAQITAAGCAVLAARRGHGPLENGDCPNCGYTT